MTQTKRKLTIPRDRWLHGEGTNGSSKLFRSSDKKQCCVGFYLEACGIPIHELMDIGPAHAFRLNQQLPAEARWLLDMDVLHHGSEIAYALYRANDHTLTATWRDSYDRRNVSLASEEDREARIIELFAKQGVEVTFV